WARFARDGGRPEGKPTTIWVVRLGDDLFVRSVNGRAAAWFWGTQAHHEGRSSAGGVTRDATFVDAKGDLDDRIDDAYRTTYRRYSPGIAGSVLTPPSGIGHHQADPPSHDLVAMVDRPVEREQRVTPLELFFDLVVVFAITQVTELMSNDPSWRGGGARVSVL